MAGVCKAVRLGELASSFFDIRQVDLDGDATGATDEVMVMRAELTAAVEDLAALAPDAVDLALFGEGPQLVVDRREPDPLSSRPQAGVELLGARELAQALEQPSERLALPSGAPATLRRRGGGGRAHQILLDATEARASLARA